MRNVILFAVSALAALPLIVAGQIASAPAPSAPAAPVTWNLTLEARGNLYVMDSGLSLGDCWQSLQVNDKPGTGGWACERNGR